MFSRTKRSSRSVDYKGLWVALDNCRFDSSTKKPVEGDVVDADAELGALCTRMRESGRSACTILFCDNDVTVERSASERAAVLPEAVS